MPPRITQTVVCSLGLVTLAPAARTADDAATQELKDYTLFVGLDILAQYAGAPAEIQNVSAREVYVLAEGAAISVPLSSLGDFYTSRTISVSDTHVELANVVAEFTQTAEADRMLELTREQAGSAGLEFHNRQKLASAELATIEAGSNPTRFNPLTPGAPEDPARERQQRAWEGQVEARRDVASQPRYVPSFDEENVHDGIGDTFEYSFEVSARHRIEDAYIVLLTSMWAPENPGTPVEMVAVRDLPVIATKPRKVRLRLKGVPPAAALKDVEVHVFSEGRELATTLSEKAVAVTRSNAFRYLFAEHLGRHAKEDVPPRPVTALIPRDFRERLPQEQFHRLVTVEVAADGTVRQVDLQGSGDSEADTYITAVINDAYFFPQLFDGKPAESKQTYQLFEFVH